MLTIISCTTPTERWRSGRQITASIASPSRPLSSTASGSAIHSEAPMKAVPPSHRAITAPKVTISPWAKLEMPVVPKTSERPTEASPSMRPKLMPWTRRWTSCVAKALDSRSPSPMKKLTAFGANGTFGVTSLVSGVSSSGSSSVMPSGSVSTSRTTVYSADSGTLTCHWPRGPVSTVCGPPGPSTVMETPSMASPSFWTLPAILNGSPSAATAGPPPSSVAKPSASSSMVAMRQTADTPDLVVGLIGLLVLHASRRLCRTASGTLVVARVPEVSATASERYTQRAAPAGVRRKAPRSGRARARIVT
jgi:hypothetical protein